MAISERVNHDEINIHNLQETPEARPDQIFDIKMGRELEESKDWIKHEIEKSENPNKFVRGAACLKLIWPNEKLAYNSSNEDLMFPGRISQNITCWDALEYLYFLKILQPDLNIEPLFTKITQDPDFVKILALDMRREEHIALTRLTSAVKIINPSFELPVPIKQITNGLKAREKSSRGTTEFLDVFARGRLIDPEYKPEPDSINWDRVSERLDSFKANGKWVFYVVAAAHLKIITAYSVRIAAPGVIDIQIYPPKDVNDSTPPMPETRKF